MIEGRNEQTKGTNKEMKKERKESYVKERME